MLLSELWDWDQAQLGFDLGILFQAHGSRDFWLKHLDHSRGFLGITDLIPTGFLLQGLTWEKQLPKNKKPQKAWKNPQAAAAPAGMGGREKYGNGEEGKKKQEKEGKKAEQLLHSRI